VPVQSLLSNNWNVTVPARSPLPAGALREHTLQAPGLAAYLMDLYFSLSLSLSLSLCTHTSFESLASRRVLYGGRQAENRPTLDTGGSTFRSDPFIPRRPRSLQRLQTTLLLARVKQVGSSDAASCIAPVLAGLGPQNAGAGGTSSSGAKMRFGGAS
jgi:hypothetical protein